MNKLLIIATLLSLALAHGHKETDRTAQSVSLITFKSKDCQELAQYNGFGVFGEDQKYLKNAGVMIVYKKQHEIALTFSQNDFSEFEDCIETIEKDQTVTIDDPPAQDLSAEAAADYMQWQLKRITQRQLPLAQIHKIELQAESHVYIVDSGIDYTHPQLNKYVAEGAGENKAFAADYCCSTSLDALCDCNQHGTHCAGLVASEIAGYNQFVTLHSAKVFDMYGSAQYSTILEAMDWTLQTHMANHAGSPGIVSMSLGGGYSAAINTAVQNLHDGGMFVVVAAGNSNKDSCTGSPAGSPHAFTVASSSIDDSRSYFSEYGSCVDTFAPGEQIYSTVPGNSYAYLSGTSMATPLVAGLASYLATAKNTADPKEIKFILQCLATQNVVTDAKSEKNIMPFDDLSEFDESNPWCVKAVAEDAQLLRFIIKSLKQK